MINVQWNAFMSSTIIITNTNSVLILIVTFFCLVALCIRNYWTLSHLRKWFINMVRLWLSLFYQDFLHNENSKFSSLWHFPWSMVLLHSHCDHSDIYFHPLFSHLLPSWKSLLFGHVSVHCCNTQDDCRLACWTQDYLHLGLHGPDAFHALLWECRDGTFDSHGLCRYIAICKPLFYSTVMSYRLLSGFMIFSWTTGFLHTMSHMVLIVDYPSVATML